MDTQLLEAFVAVAESGSFSAAAERIHITQPAVSKRIAQLEDHLDCRLFDRISRTIYLTEAGNALLPRALSILRALEDSKQAIRDLSGGISGNLRMAISHHLGLHRLPPILKEFSASHPEATLGVSFMDSEVAYEGILQGKYEVAVITLAPEPHPRIETRPIWRDNLRLMVSPDHPLACETTVSIRALSHYPAILPGTETYTGQIIKKLFVDAGYDFTTSMATNYLETIKMLVSVGLGWSILPEIMADESLHVLRCEGLELSRQLGIIHHREKTLSNVAQAFIELLQAHAE